MTVRIYRSTDAGAPTLGANSGSLIAVLDACLVNGYGDKSPAGWEKVFEESTLRAAYKQGRGNRHVFYVDDSNGVITRCAGHETFDETGVGTGRFPFDDLLYVVKHNGAAGDRDWLVVASEDLFYFITQYDTNVNWTSSVVTIFGKIRSYVPDDKHDAFLMASTKSAPYGNPSSNTTSNNTDTAHISQIGVTQMCYTFGTVIDHPGHIMARRWHGSGSSVVVSKYGVPFNMGQESMNKVNYFYGGISYLRLGADTVNTPNAPDGNIYLNQLKIMETGPVIRGEITGMWQSYVSATYYRPFDIIEGTGLHAGKQFMHIPMWHGCFMLEVSDTW